MGAEPVLSLLFEEAFEQRCGRMALVERLVEVVMIQILRQLMESDEVSGGLLSGLAHPRLRNALVAMHEAPAQDWTLDNLAGVAGMSRSAFATSFRETLGQTPGQYSAGLARPPCAEGAAARTAAEGDRHRGRLRQRSALSRAFKAQAGQSPRNGKPACRLDRRLKPPCAHAADRSAGCKGSGGTRN